MLKTRDDAIKLCSEFEDVYEDYPFADKKSTAMRHKTNKKIFALIFERFGNVWINVKCRPDDAPYLRQMFPSVIPAYHMNKNHWNSIIVDGTIDCAAIYEMIKQSYFLTKQL